MYGHGGGIGGMGGLGSYGDGGFGDVRTDWRNWIRSAYRGTTPGLSTAAMIYDKALTKPANPDAWVASLPSKSCADLARSIGQSFDTTAICAAFDEALGVASGVGWNVVREEIRLDLAAAEAKRWETATCADRVVADGGGSVCTAGDGLQQVRCYNPTTGVMDTYADNRRCPGGTGGMPRTLTVVARPKVLQTLRPVVAPGPSKPVVSGYVVGPDGTGIVGANVQLRQPMVEPGAMMISTFAPSTTTDFSGAFLLEPKPSTYEVVVTATGFNEAVFGPITVPATGSVDVGALALEATAVLPPPPVECSEGKVLDPVTGECVAAPVVAKPWYKSPLVWVIGGVVVVGGGYLLLRKKG